MQSLLLTLLTLVNVLAIAQTDQANIFYNGKIFTGNPFRTTVQAVAIRGDKIIAAGDLGPVQNIAGKNVKMVDLKGACMMPGIIDSHNHAISGGRSLLAANLNDTLLSGDALLRYAQEAIASGKGLRGDVVYIQGVHSATWNDVSLLRRIFDDPSLGGRAVFLKGSDGHTSWGNSTLLRRAGINAVAIKTLPATEQVYFATGEDGEPNGLVAESAIAHIEKAIPPSEVKATDALVGGIKHLNSLGITGWMDPAAGSTRDGMHNQALQAYQEVSRSNQLTAHVTAVIVANGNEPPEPQLETARAWQAALANDKHISVAGFKIFSDGVMEYPTQTASMSSPYKNSGLTGSLMVDPEKLKRFVMAADRDKLLVHVHAIGDNAVTVALDAIEAVRKQHKNKDIPHSITHLQCVQAGDLERFGKLNVPASMQLLWATADSYTAELVQPYIDESACTYMYPARSIQRRGGTHTRQVKGVIN